MKMTPDISKWSHHVTNELYHVAESPETRPKDPFRQPKGPSRRRRSNHAAKGCLYDAKGPPHAASEGVTFCKEGHGSLCPLRVCALNLVTCINCIQFWRRSSEMSCRPGHFLGGKCIHYGKDFEPGLVLNEVSIFQGFPVRVMASIPRSAWIRGRRKQRLSLLAGPRRSAVCGSVRPSPPPPRQQRHSGRRDAASSLAPTNHCRLPCPRPPLPSLPRPRTMRRTPVPGPCGDSGESGCPDCSQRPSHHIRT